MLMIVRALVRSSTRAFVVVIIVLGAINFIEFFLDSWWYARIYLSYYRNCKCLFLILFTSFFLLSRYFAGAQFFSLLIVWFIVIVILLWCELDIFAISVGVCVVLLFFPPLINQGHKFSYIKELLLFNCNEHRCRCGGSLGCQTNRMHTLRKY